MYTYYITIIMDIQSNGYVYMIIGMSTKSAHSHNQTCDKFLWWPCMQMQGANGPMLPILSHCILSYTHV